MTSLTLEEAQIRTSGNDAEVSVPGVSMVAVIKSGSNEFHGSYIASLERPEMQGNNLSDSLRAQGLSNTAPASSRRERRSGGDRPRKYRFYPVPSCSRQGVGRRQLRHRPGGQGYTPATSRGCSDAVPTPMNVVADAKPSADRAWQPTSNQPRGCARAQPLPSARSDAGYQPADAKASGHADQPRLTVGGGGYLAAAPGARKFAPVVPGNPPADRDGLNTGANPKPTQITATNGSWTRLAFVLIPRRSSRTEGRHDAVLAAQRRRLARAPGGRHLITIGSAASRYTPTQIQIRNSPTQPNARANYYAGYLKDLWRTDHAAEPWRARRAEGVSPKQ
jgi:hypothetical protein